MRPTLEAEIPRDTLHLAACHAISRDLRRHGKARKFVALALPHPSSRYGATVMRHNLTDRFIASRKPAKPGERDDYADAIVPGLLLRVTDRSHRSFVLRARYPSHPKNP